MKYLYITSAIFLIACGTAKVVAPTAPAVAADTEQTQVARGAARYPGYTTDMLSEGKSLYEGNCGNCHGLYKPTSETPEKWAEIVPWMAKKTNKAAGSEILDATKQDLILKYLVTMTTAPKG